MQPLIDFVSSHLSLLSQLFVIAAVIAELCSRIANVLAKPFPRAAHVFAGISELLPQVLGFLARAIAALTGKPFAPAMPPPTTVAVPSEPNVSAK